jgi:hypothetical protein
LDGGRCLDDLGVGVIEEVVQVVEGGGVLVLEAVQKALLDHSELVAPIINHFLEPSDLCPNPRVLINHVEELVQRYSIWKAELELLRLCENVMKPLRKGLGYIPEGTEAWTLQPEFKVIL